MTADQLRRLLTDVHLEVIPLPGMLEQAEAAPAGSVLTVTASPSRGLENTIDFAVELQARGYETVPHLSARLVADRHHLGKILARLDEAGVRRVLVIGGDPEPIGDFREALGVLEAMAEMGHPFLEVGVAGYPEGHPIIPDEHLREALLAKAVHATYIVTQMSFHPRAIVDWVRSIRSDGIDLPVRVGLPGAVDLAHLVRVARRIGVGDSVSFITKNRGLLRILRPGGYRPGRLVTGLAGAAGDGGLAGLHVFTFNQVASTVAWHRKMLARLG